MYGTELREYRNRVREQLKNTYLGIARQDGYYDVAEALRMTGPFIAGGLNAVRTRLLCAHAWMRLGVPIEQACLAYGVNQDQVGSLSLGDFIVTDAVRAALEAEVVKTVPETTEPQRYVTAYHTVGGDRSGIQTDQSSGKPQPVAAAPTGYTGPPGGRHVTPPPSG